MCHVFLFSLSNRFPCFIMNWLINISDYFTFLKMLPNVLWFEVIQTWFQTVLYLFIMILPYGKIWLINFTWYNIIIMSKVLPGESCIYRAICCWPITYHKQQWNICFFVINFEANAEENPNKYLFCTTYIVMSLDDSTTQ